MNWVSGGISRKIRKVKAQRGGSRFRNEVEGTRKDEESEREGDREVTTIGNGRIGGCGDPAGAGGAGDGVDEWTF